MEQLLLQISYYIVLLPLSTGVIFWRQTEKFSRWILLLSFIATIPHLLAAAGFPPAQRNIIYNLYTAAEFAIMIAIFKPKFSTPFSIKLFKASLLFFAALSIPLLLRKNFIYDFNNQWVCLTNLVYLFWILVLMRDTYINDTPIFQRNDPFSFFAIGIVVYASSSMLVMALYNYLIENKDSPVSKLWIFHDFSNIFIYIMFFFVIITNIRNKKTLKIKHE